MIYSIATDYVLEKGDMLIKNKEAKQWNNLFWLELQVGQVLARRQ
jgi:hypothetical protein